MTGEYICDIKNQKLDCQKKFNWNDWQRMESEMD